MTAQTFTLTDFLLARIADDEAFWRREVNDLVMGSIAERVLAECEAKRRIVEQEWAEVGPSAADDWLLPLLALPYADHPDYNPNWRP